MQEERYFRDDAGATLLDLMHAANTCVVPTTTGQASGVTEMLTLAWASDNPATISCGPQNAIVLKVINGKYPYDWTLVGNGYTLSGEGGKQRTLSCTSGTCGSTYDVTATVTVTDGHGDSISHTVRNNGGGWERIFRDGCNGTYDEYECISYFGGKYKSLIKFNDKRGGRQYDETCPSCSDENGGCQDRVMNYPERYPCFEEYWGPYTWLCCKETGWACNAAHYVLGVGGTGLTCETAPGGPYQVLL